MSAVRKANQMRLRCRTPSPVRCPPLIHVEGFGEDVPVSDPRIHPAQVLVTGELPAVHEGFELREPEEVDPAALPSADEDEQPAELPSVDEPTDVQPLHADIKVEADDEVVVVEDLPPKGPLPKEVRDPL